MRPRLRLYGAGRHLTGSEAFPDGAGDGGTRGAARPGQEGALEDCGPRVQGQGAEDRCGLLSTGCHAAVPQQVAAGDPGDHLQDRDAVAARGWTSTTGQSSVARNRQ